MADKTRGCVPKREARGTPSQKEAFRETKGWPPERRARQAENIRNSKAWERSTGPRTAEGKQAVKNNAHKHGWRSVDIAEVRRLLRLQRQIVRDIEDRHCEERQRRSNPESSPETMDCRVGLRPPRNDEKRDSA